MFQILVGTWTFDLLKIKVKHPSFATLALTIEVEVCALQALL